MKIDESSFGSEIFKLLTIYDQAHYIMECPEELEGLSPIGLEMLATILIKASCRCKFYELVPDELTGGQTALPKSKHQRTCPAQLIPTNEDLDIRTVQRRQKVELLSTHLDLQIIEEKSASPRKKQRYSSE